MSTLRFILRSLWFHARSHLGAFLGSAVGAAVLVGALLVGDSVRTSLRDLAMLRLGRIELAMSTGDRLFTSPLGFAIQQGLAQAGAGRPTPPLVAEVLQLPGVVANADGTARANQVQVLGVDARFWPLAPEPPGLTSIPPDSVVLNPSLAAQLRVREGDTVLIRVRKPQALSSDAPLAPEEDTTVALRLTVMGVLGEAQFGRFGLQATQVAPYTAFVSLAMLQSRVESVGRANLLLVGPAPAPVSPAPGSRVTMSGNIVLTAGLPPVDLAAHTERVLTQRWQLADAQLQWKPVPSAAAVELRTSRIFLDPVVADTVFGKPGDTNTLLALLPRVLPEVTAAGVLTYFVNELRVGDRATPYSMVTATATALAPRDLAADEILITQWLADDLGAKPGDRLTMAFYVVGAMRQLEERTASFRVKAILPMDAPGLDRDLMPDFPGMADADNCRDWDTGLPIDTDRIRPKDEDYWRDHRGTPKAVISLQAGQQLWSNRFGDLTAIRFGMPAVAATNANLLARALPNYQATLGTLLTRLLEPEAFGLRFEPVRDQALAASSQSQDFGQLFLGFSFFLILAALLLLAVLFQFSIDQRASELGTLLALGFTPGKAGRLLLLEAGLVALGGCALGAWAGRWYAQAMLHGLSTIWSAAVGGTAIRFHDHPATLVTGALAATFAAGLTMALALRRHLKSPARQLMSEGGSEWAEAAQFNAGRRAWSGWVALGTLAAAAGLLGTGLSQGRSASAGIFFGAGALLLVAGMAAGSAMLTRLDRMETETQLTLRGLGIRSVTRRRRRSLAVMGLLACGSFLVASIGVFRLDAGRAATERHSGTGGFALYGESTQPVTQDLNAPAGADTFGLDTNVLARVEVVPFRVRDGDDASCLNLNRAQKPRLLGVKPEQLADRDAFRFASLARGADRDRPWLNLKREAWQARGETVLADDEVPVIGDQASIQWALGSKVGGTLEYTDERGRAFTLRIVGAVANSILQGNLVIDEAEFVRRFPSTTGYRVFLVDASPADQQAVSAELSRGLRDLGLELTPTTSRLAAFNAVQNTYLGTFQVLGGLGLLLGSAGLGVVVLRNVLERRGELALLLAVGFRRRALRQLVLSEHTALLLAGLGIGVLAAAVAVLPSVLLGAAEIPVGSLGLTLVAILANGALWTWLASETALRGRLLPALRNS